MGGITALSSRPMRDQSGLEESFFEEYRATKRYLVKM